VTARSPVPPTPPEPPTPPAAPAVPLTPQRRRELTRQHLLEAAAAVFAREGFYGASLDEVAAAAGFTKGAVYSNFKNKEALFVAVLEERMASQIAAVERILDDAQAPDAHLGEILDVISSTEFDPSWGVLNLEFFLYAARNEEARELLAGQVRRTRDLVERMVARQQEKTGVQADIPPRAFATIALALFAGLDLHRLLDPDEVTTETLDQVLVFFTATGRGMGAEPRSGGDPDRA
jgi:AcrR family transcriptional regulator